MSSEAAVKGEVVLVKKLMPCMFVVVIVVVLIT